MMMDRSDEIFSLFESVCPTEGCGTEVQIVGVGGTKLFLTMQPWVKDLNLDFNHWAEDYGIGDGLDSNGQIDFECVQGHKHTIEHGPWSDWR